MLDNWGCDHKLVCEAPGLDVCEHCNVLVYYTPAPLAPLPPEDKHLAILTPMLRQEFLDLLRDGAGMASAKRACGILPALWKAWQTSKHSLAVEFLEEAHAAVGKARAMAEIAVHKANPITWITKGPGRTDWDAEDAWVDTTTKIAVSGQVDHTHTHEHTHGIDVSRLSPALLAELDLVLDNDDGIIEAELLDSSPTRALPPRA